MISNRHLLQVLFLIFLVTALCGSAVAQEWVSPFGILARGNVLFLFTRVEGCLGEQAAQIFLSEDGGKTWAKQGPSLGGSDFYSILDTGTELWIAGQHTAEGPGTDPFLLKYSANQPVWDLQQIYEGAAELLGSALQNDGKTIWAWVRHVQFSSPKWTGPIYLHKSMDRGRTWSAVKKVRRVPTSASHLSFFQEIKNQSGDWRISGLGEFGHAIEHQRSDQTWHVISEFPMFHCGK